MHRGKEGLIALTSVSCLLVGVLLTGDLTDNKVSLDRLADNGGEGKSRSHKPMFERMIFVMALISHIFNCGFSNLPLFHGPDGYWIGRWD